MNSTLSTCALPSQTVIAELPRNDTASLELFEAWSDLLEKSPGYESPYFHPGFCQAVAASGVNVEYMVLKQSGAIVGVLPFQRKLRRLALPVGGGLNDAHGPIVAPGIEFPWFEFFRKQKLASFAVHACPDSISSCKRLETSIPAYRANLQSTGEDSYGDHLATVHRTISRQGQKDRKLTRQQGPLTFEFQSRDPRMLELLMQWKSDQYRRTHLFDIFTLPWVRHLLNRLHAKPDHGDVQGILSVLYAGGQPIAMHFGMRYRKLLHYWYPVYNPNFGFASPGTRLFLEIAAAAKREGIETIDFGYGDQAYKHKLCNERYRCGAGLITNSSLHHAVYRTRQWTRSMGKKLWFKEALKPWVRKIVPNPESRDFKF